MRWLVVAIVLLVVAVVLNLGLWRTRCTRSWA